MNQIKNYLFATAGVALLMLVVPPISSDSKASDHEVYMTAIKNLVTLSQTALDEATRGVEKQRALVKALGQPRSSAIGQAIGNKASDGNEEASRREKAVLQQLEANARRNAEVLESAKLLARELKKVDCKTRQQ